MLAPLVSYARSHGLVAEPGFAPKTVRWAVVCDPKGKLLEVLDLATEPKSPGRVFPRCPELSQPEIKRGGAGCRHFLADSADVVALFTPGAPDAKLLAKHAYFTKLLRQASAVLPVLAGIADTLDDPESLKAIREHLQSHKGKSTDKVTVSVLGASPAFPVDSEVWHDWWRSFRRTLSDEKPAKGSGRRVRCLASGELVVPAATHPKIAGLADVGGLSMGDVLASFKQESFCSYGFEQSANAPVSEAMAAEYRAALNQLIKETGRRLAGAKVVHWFKDRLHRGDDDPFDLLMDESTEEANAQQRARKLLAAIETGERPDLLDNRYYSLTLSGASGRVMVRDWMEGQFADLVRNVNGWFDHLSIVHRAGVGLARPPRMISLLASLVRDLADLPPPLEVQVWRVAVRCEPIPQQVMARALARLKVDIVTDQAFNHARLGLLKAFHVRKGDPFMEPYLNESHPDAAYHCGRLMAMLAALQYRALGDVGAGVIQRYYAAASATPALVLGRLVRTSQFHLDKLDRGLARWHEGRIAETFGRIHTDIPLTLTLERQSLFALGYYQQIAFDRSRTRPESAPGATSEISTSDSQETGHA
jgi:CRISPR-associated protein Csd1